ncbi:MAG TPA: tetratricopeptide repeat protein, partial [Blastocatellia bacterium]|nr:tetratricopeptide repeat protein [Blastocatellia bacterium]
SFYWEKNDYAKAEPLYLRALSIWERTLGPEHPIVAASLNNLGMIYNDTGEYAKAEALLMRALAINEKALGPNHPNVAKSLDSLADIYRERGDFTKAEQFYERARAIREKAFGPEHQEVTVSLGHLGLVYRGRGDYEKAEPIYRRTLATLEKELGPDHTMVAAALSNLGALYQEKGEYAKTEPLLQRALSIWEKALGPDNADVGLCLSNLGVFYMDRNDYAKAGPLLTRAQAIWEKALGPDHPDVAISLSNLGLLYFNQGDYLKAEPFHQRALAIREKALGPDHHSVAKTLNYLTLVSMARGEIQRAVAFQSRANAVSEHNLTLNLLTGSERQKLAYLALFTKETDLTLTLHSRAAPNDPQALELAFATLLRRKGRGLDAMTDTITALRSHAAPQDQELFDRLAAARSRLATLTLKDAGAANPELYRLQIKPLEDQIEGLEAALSARSAPFRSQSQPVTIAAVQAALPADGALIEFTAFTPMDLRTADPQPPRYLAYVLSAQGPPRSVDLGPAAPIDRAVKAWRRSLRETRPDVKSLARVVDEKIMRPVQALLPQEGSVHRLLIAPDGQLNLIPFAALVDQQNRYLVERYSISYLTSGRDLLRLQTMPPSRNAPLVVANPIFGGGTLVATRSVQLAGGKSAGKPAGHQGKSTTDSPEYFFKPLPATGREAQAIKAVLPEAAVLVRESATEAKLKQLKAPSLLHIATHGFFLDDQPAAPALTRSLTAAESPEGAGLRLSRWAAKIGNPLLRSGLALAGANDHAGGDDDGLLTALEATSLDLWGTQLVVLSACDTGVGQVMKGEGVYGLRRALVLAGSETQVMSLWPVPDSETSSLMVGYYGRLMKDEGRGEALRQIQLEMLKDAKLRHPYYWASFVQAGEWANLEGRR